MASVSDVWALPRAMVQRRRQGTRGVDQHFHLGLTRVLASEHVAGWEWGVAIGALFILGRSNILFFRQRLWFLFSGRAGALWQDDVVLQAVFGTAMLVVLVAALRRARPSALLRQPLLLAFIGMAWLSVMWSVEPEISVRRVPLFLGTVIVGWYIGDRFPPRYQIALVAAVGAVAAAWVGVALIFWNELARTTSGAFMRWSGIYINRNLLGLVISFGLMAVLFLLRTAKRKWPLRTLVGIFLFILFMSQSRSGPIAMVSALAVAVAVWLFRRKGASRLSAASGAYVTFASLGTIGLFVHYYWTEILEWLGRDPTLTNRTDIWQVNHFFSNQRPWNGWGFEALWTNEKAIEQAYNATGKYPYSSHNGYYEMLLGVGRIGLFLFVAFLAVAAWRAFRYAWERSDSSSLWPLTFIVFAAVMNFSESLFLSSEAVLALTVAAAVGASEWPRREDPDTRLAPP